MSRQNVSALLTECELETPAFVYDEEQIRLACQNLRTLCDRLGCHPLFSLKALGLTGLLSSMVPYLCGISVSSLYEARLVRESLVDPSRTDLHVTTPGLTTENAQELAELCDFASFNSLSQYSRCSVLMAEQANLGLRVNPELSSVADPRYDPCRRHSKLGIPLSDLERVLAGNPAPMKNISGLHLHTNCDSADFSALQKTVSKLLQRIPKLVERAGWMNLGGGYLYGHDSETQALAQTLHLLRENNEKLKVYVEPGAALVRSSGYLVTSVIDLFRNQDKIIAVLDTTVNHAPEVFEYGYEPDAYGDDDTAPNHYILAGCTCLAGDVFGHYGFFEPLEIGSRIVFQDMGAYALVKSHTFNGVPLPSVIALKAGGQLTPIHTASYQDYKRQWGGKGNEAS